ncbi:YugN family protein [Paenibacillus sepulcri]|uniref:YugN-like family protein n=1 Tax=Paenibacillus sepulcri TaxID=359917 RepID=A0ABS7CF57_9BACL|nr:YugN-like family protein [Paenibacillus sepulcri]
MIPLSSKLESREHEFSQMKNALEEHEFALGGSWSYEGGSFDRFLDEAHKVWLRLPFDVVSGNVDSESDDNHARIKMGQPFVLRHVYNEGLDEDTVPRVMGGLINQFQGPTDPDAEIDSKWIDKAKHVLGEVEQLFPH